MCTYPPSLVDELVVETGRKGQRHRSLPARMMACFAIGMAMHSEGPYEDVLALLSDGLRGSLEPAHQSRAFNFGELLAAPRAGSRDQHTKGPTEWAVAQPFS